MATMAAAENIESSKPEPVSGVRRIHASDAGELRWYFSDPQIAGIGGSGGLGAMLERAAVMAIQLVPCTRCGGDRETDRPGTGACARDGGGYGKALERHWRAEAKRLGLRLVADVETARGWRDLGVKAVAGEEIAQHLPDKMTKHCYKCDGSGMTQRRRSNRGGAVTARATGSSVHGNPDAMHWIDEAGLARYGRITRQLDQVGKRSHGALAALSVYFGPQGGSAAALWQLTAEGRRFIERTANAHHLSAEELMQNEREAHRMSPSVERALMFSRIAREAAEVWDAACAAWLDVAGSGDE